MSAWQIAWFLSANSLLVPGACRSIVRYSQLFEEEVQTMQLLLRTGSLSEAEAKSSPAISNAVTTLARMGQLVLEETVRCRSTAIGQL